MALDLSVVADALASAAWPFGRVSGFVMTAPMFSANLLPMRVRVAFVVLLTVVVLPLAPRSAAIAPLSASGVAVTVAQVAIGALLGFALRLIFEAVAFGGELVATSMGLNYASVLDPQHGNITPVVGQLYTVLAMLLFLTMDGHLALVELLADSFRSLPADAFALDAGLFHALAGYGSDVFSGALRVALPAMTALLVVNLAFGFTSRAAPALNLFAVGFPITLAAGFALSWIALRGLPQTFASLQGHLFDSVRVLIGAGP
jgi:flagellar biosynthetic protein FliR